MQPCPQSLHAYSTKAGRRAFTLIELILVCALMLVLVTVSTPGFKKTYDDLKFISAAKDLASIVHYCRQKAIMEREEVRLLINPQEGYYRVFAESDSGVFEPIRGSWGRRFKVPRAVTIESIPETIDFMPNGNATQAEIYITNRKGITKTISIQERTGVAKIYDYRKE